MVEIIVPEVRMKQDTGKLYKMALVIFGTSHFLFVVFQCGGFVLCCYLLYEDVCGEMEHFSASAGLHDW